MLWEPVNSHTGRVEALTFVPIMAAFPCFVLFYTLLLSTLQTLALSFLFADLLVFSP